jgi:hypothetical protein
MSIYLGSAHMNFMYIQESVCLLGINADLCQKRFMNTTVYT